MRSVFKCAACVGGEERVNSHVNHSGQVSLDKNENPDLLCRLGIFIRVIRVTFLTWRNAEIPSAF